MMPALFDIHSHLNFSDFDDDRENVIKRMFDSGVWTINVGADLESSKKAVELAEKYGEGIYATVGVHPDEIKNFNIAELRKLAIHPKVVAIGECGIDIKARNSKHEIRNGQVEIFKQQIELAKELDKPLMIHCRNAHKEILEIFKKYNHYGNIHFFSGDWEEARKYFDLGFTISFTGVITFTHDYDEVIKKAPLEKIMIETDAPFVTPVPYRDKRNEPVYVIEVAKRIAEIKNITYEEVAKITAENALKLFKIC